MNNKDLKKKNFTRKFIEQQATKDFIKKENKFIKRGGRFIIPKNELEII